MKKPIILNAESEGYSEEAQSILNSCAEVINFTGNRENLLRKAWMVEGLIVRLGFSVDKEFLGAFPSLKFVATPTTGLNHVDIQEIKRQKITLLSLKGEYDFLNGVTATAELAWGLLLSLIRNLQGATQSVKNGCWDRNQFKGRELKGKYLGVIGYGRLGKMVANYGDAFGMKVLINDLNPIYRGHPNYRALNDLLKNSDVVSIHIPLEADTVNFINKKKLALLKKDALLINTSRGEIIDEAGLFEMLCSGSIAGAALDVISDEPNTGDRFLTIPPLIAYAKANNNLLISPHIGGATIDSMKNTEIFMAKKIVNFLKENRKNLNGN